MVPRGLEPRTLRLLAVRSDQLSYETSDNRRVFPIQTHQTTMKNRRFPLKSALVVGLETETAVCGGLSRRLGYSCAWMWGPEYGHLGIPHDSILPGCDAGAEARSKIGGRTTGRNPTGIGVVFN